MKNLRVSKKLIISFAIVIVLAVMVALTGMFGMNQIKEAADDVYNYNVVAMDALGLIRENFALQRFTTREMILYPASTEEYAKAEAHLNDLEIQMEEYIAQYRPTMRTEEDITVFEEFLDVYYSNYRDYKTEFIQYARLNQTDKALLQIHEQASKIATSITEILDLAHSINVKAAKDSLKRNSSLFDTMAIVEAITLTASVLIVILLVVYLTRLIARPLTNIFLALDHMSSTGDMMLNERTLKESEEATTRTDEIGMTSGAIIKLLRHIWNTEQTLTHISNGDFNVNVKTLSDRDTLGLSVSRVADSLNTMFSKMKEAEEEALAASKAKGAFLAHMSHEIRTPLNAIMGMSMIIGKSAGDKEKTLSSVDQIMLSSRHLLSIVNDVLDMSKIESGRFELSNEPFLLRTGLDEVLGVIAQRCSEKHLQFTFDTGQTDNLTIIGDKTRINQVLINLLGNAVKFTDDHGEVRFSTELLEEGEEDVRLRFTVSDTGIGISSEQLSRLFLPFEQGSNTIAPKYGGTGLGLSISRNLVNMMGGMLRVESKLGAGTTFFFELIFKKGEIKAAASEETAENIDLSGRRLLLVEDVEINSVIMRELLTPTGVAIDVAENGREAVELFERSPEGYYSLIFMDVQMPVMDGYTATGSIRGLARGDAKSVPIIAMTANAYKEDVVRSLDSGMNGHLSKPIDVSAMIRVLREYIKN